MTSERNGPVRTVLRGEQLRQQLEAGGTPAHSSAHVSAPMPSASGGGDTGKLINGVPASAAVHCCGRGCAHCRIYWRKSDA